MKNRKEFTVEYKKKATVMSKAGIMSLIAQPANPVILDEADLQIE